MKKIYVFILMFIMYSGFAQDGNIIAWNSTINCSGNDITIDPYDNIYLYDSNGNIKKILPSGELAGAPYVSPSAQWGYSLYYHSNGNIYSGGLHKTEGGAASNILKYDAITGAIDLNFVAQLPEDINVVSISEAPNGKLLVGFVKYSQQTVTVKGFYCLSEITGSIYSTFNNGISGIESGSNVWDTAIDNNDNIIIVGNFNQYNSYTRSKIARLTQNGNLDPNFITTGINTNGNVQSVAFQESTNSYIIGGDFSYGQQHGLLKIKSDGQIDSSFNPNIQPISSGTPVKIYKVLVQCSGKIIISGYFKYIENELRPGIARLNMDGTLDTTFNPGLGLQSDYYGSLGRMDYAVLDSEQNLFSSGNFVKYNVTPVNYIAKIKTDNDNLIIAVDDNATIPSSSITQTAISNILSNDIYNEVTATTSNVTITQVSTENPGVYLEGTAIKVNANTPQGQYKVVYKICGIGDCYCKTATATITIGNSVISASGETSVFCQMAVPSETIAIVGLLEGDKYNNQQANLDNVDLTILSPLPEGLNHIITGNEEYFEFSSLLQPGTYNIQYKICDKLDPSNCKTATNRFIILTRCENNYNMGQANNTVRVSGIQSSHKIVIAGDFSTYGPSAKNKIARLKHEDLTLDTSFTATGPGSGQSILDFKVLTNDYIIAVGNFTSFNGFQRNGITKLTQNGDMDYSFNYAAITSNPTTAGFKKNGGQATIYCIEIDHLGRILVGGDFTHYNNIAIKNIARLTSTGNLDISNFNPGVSFDGLPYKIVSLGSAGILVGGTFNNYKGMVAKKVVKLDNSANKMTGFNSTYLTGSYVEEITGFAGGFVLAGSFTNYAGYTRNNFVVVNENGIINTNISPSFTGGAVKTVASVSPNPYLLGYGANGTSYINSFVGGVYVGGEFTAVNGNTTDHNLVFIKADGSINPNFDPGTGPDSPVYTITPEENDYKIILGGSFQNYNNEWTGRITRIFPGNYVYSFAPVGFDPSNTGQVQMREANTSDLIFENSIRIYPNPSEGIYNIDFKGYEEQKFNMTIYNTLGQLIYEGVVTPENTNQIDLTRFESGSYFITLQSSSKTINKVVIKK